ncbi:unnamed protein product [Medioppia subpectinata]|uniref:Uncharacterized protein n=1 Tax=Medioppia subpectinata TaxID=1979941 RepID=A0A7R9KJQ0_9ACAR|nr:unnamed protein product [Medioppia subpectinata]CAG2104659.1 unnamed protein product [Medioppia subpectinata]
MDTPLNIMNTHTKLKHPFMPLILTINQYMNLTRKVDYIADDHGFRASISSNEPGVGSASPADVQLYAKEPPAVAPYKAQSYGHPIYAQVPKPYASYPVPQYHPYRHY